MCIAQKKQEGSIVEEAKEHGYEFRFYKILSDEFFNRGQNITQLDHQAQAETNMNRVYTLMKDLQH